MGVEKELVLGRFLSSLPGKFEAAKGDPRMCAVVIDCDATTGKARTIDRLMLGE
ncbi:MAG TPA: YmdB family metallophosphoesterase [Terriglobales bacterium]